MNWEQLKNPVLEYPTWSIKDYGIAYEDGVFYLFFSAFYEDNGRVRSHVVEVTTPDFKAYSEPILNFDGQEDGWIGMCSPDVMKAGDTYYLVFNSWGDKEGKPNQLFYMSSSDMANWSARKPLAANLTQGKWAIDAALAFESGKYFLFWKEQQTARCAVGDSIDGDFRFIGDGYPKFQSASRKHVPWNENYQLLKTDGKWHLLATTHGKTRSHAPIIYDMQGDCESEANWAQWTNGRELFVADEQFNTRDQANSAVLLDLTCVDGFYYLLYAGTTEREAYLRRGWNKLGVSRSEDLTKWMPAGVTSK